MTNSYSYCLYEKCTDCPLVFRCSYCGNKATPNQITYTEDKCEYPLEVLHMCPSCGYRIVNRTSIYNAILRQKANNNE